MQRLLPHRRQNLVDAAFSAFLFLLCAGLAALQYHWTGQLADAEEARLRGNLSEQTRALARAFTIELADSREQLVPERGDRGDAAGLAARELARYHAWQEGHPRPIFRLLALATASEDAIHLSLLDANADRFVPGEWPAAWSALRDNLQEKLSGRGSPFFDETGTLLELPLTMSPHGHPGPENAEEPGPRSEPHDFAPPPETPDRGAWLVLELDDSYLRGVWLPDLVARYLNPDGRMLNEARVRVAGPGGQILYASPGAADALAGSAVSVPFDLRGRDGPPRGPGEPGRWLLEAWPRPGALDALVASSRHRNLAVAGALNLLVLASGLALIRHARGSRRLAEAQMNFVANVSHELRTPLTVIHGAAANLQRGVVRERAQVERYADLILQHSEQLTGMVEQLIDLASLRQHPAAPELRPVAVDAILREALAAAQHDIGLARCTVETEIPASLPPVLGDPSALRRIFQNLIANAAKHGGTGGWIGLSAASASRGSAGEVEVRIADRGPGIPLREQPAIFQPFVRGERAQAEQVRGSGLGLSLVREIVEQHHGSVEVSSEPGRGAVFIVRLPAAPR